VAGETYGVDVNIMTKGNDKSAVQATQADQEKPDEMLAKRGSPLTIRNEKRSDSQAQQRSVADTSRGVYLDFHRWPGGTYCERVMCPDRPGLPHE
jgi:hypothetical protein